MSSKNILTISAALLGLGCGIVVGAGRARRRFSFAGRVVVITGGSRGLGLVLARQLARQGARLALLARDETELARAGDQLSQLGGDVLTLPCDLRRQDQAAEAIEQVANRFGALDVLINNAGVIQVGPFTEMTVVDFEEALAIHLFAPLYTTLAALPHLRRAGSGRIVNITSVGGKLAVPHLLPYTVSKFALVGLSEGLRAELRRENIFVTTVCPGLMRTGSPRHARFKGQHRREYAWFSISDSLPLLSMSAEKAARRIIEAGRRGAAQLTLGVHTKAAILFNELFPGATTALMHLANRLLPGHNGNATGPAQAGYESESAFAPSWLTRLSEQAARRNNELPS